jgi:hypothetical protein
MNPLTLFLILFIGFAVSRAYLRYRDKDIPVSQFVLWLIVWTSIAVLVFLPSTSSWLAQLSGIGRGVDAAFLIGIVLLFYLLFRLYVKMDHLDRDITSVVSRLAEQEKRRANAERERH